MLVEEIQHFSITSLSLVDRSYVKIGVLARMAQAVLLLDIHLLSNLISSAIENLRN